MWWLNIPFKEKYDGDVDDDVGEDKPSTEPNQSESKYSALANDMGSPIKQNIWSTSLIKNTRFDCFHHQLKIFSAKIPESL